MKFEIRDNDFVDSFALVIPVQDFVNAKDDPREFKGLCIAVDGFLDAFDTIDRAALDEQEYNEIYSFPGKIVVYLRKANWNLQRRKIL